MLEPRRLPLAARALLVRGAQKAGKGHWAGDRKQTTLWQISSRDQDAETVHGTQKPVECMRRPMLNNSSARARRSTSRSWAPARR